MDSVTYDSPPLPAYHQKLTYNAVPLSDQYVPYDLTQFTESDDDSCDSIIENSNSLDFLYPSESRSYSTPLFPEDTDYRLDNYKLDKVELKHFKQEYKQADKMDYKRSFQITQSIPIRRGSSLRSFRRSFLDLQSVSLEHDLSPLSNRNFKTIPITSSFTTNRATVYTHRNSESKSAMSIPSLESSSVFSPPPVVVSSLPITSVNSTTIHSDFGKGNYKSTEGLNILLCPPKSGVIPYTSNLTTKLQGWKRSSWLYLYSITPRMTDDIVPQSRKFINTPRETTPRELTTFKETKTLCDDSADELAKLVARRSFKNRDQRINSQFLRLYAMDYSARTVSHTLPNSSDVQELNYMITHRPHLKQFNYKHDLFRISSLSRDKLWRSVILDPRSDPSPSPAINGDSYINTYSTNSIVRQKGGHVPWTGSRSIKPIGILEGGKILENGMAPNSGVTRTQYVVVGWCSEKWLS